MALGYAFLDESGKFRDSSVVSFGGVIGGWQSCNALSAEWDALLVKTGMSSFEMKRAVKSNEPLSDRVPAQTPAERSAALSAFVSCISTHAELAIVMAMDVAAFQALSKLAKKRFGSQDNPHYPMFLMTVMYALRFLSNDDKLGIICDDDEETALTCYQFYRKLKKTRDDLRPRLASLTFGDDDAFNQLQVADLLAGLGRLEARKRFFGEPYDYSSWFDELDGSSRADTVRCEFGFFDKEKLMKMADSLETDASGGEAS